MKASRTLLLPAEAIPRRPRAAHQAAVPVPLPLLRGLLRVRSSVAFVSRRVRVDGVSMPGSASGVSKQEESESTALGARCVVIECRCCMAARCTPSIELLLLLYDSQDLIQDPRREKKQDRVQTPRQVASRLSRRDEVRLASKAFSASFQVFQDTSRQNRFEAGLSTSSFRSDTCQKVGLDSFSSSSAPVCVFLFAADELYPMCRGLVSYTQEQYTPN